MFNPATTPSFLTYTHFCYLPLFLCYFDPIFTDYNFREKRSWHWCGLMCSHCGSIETPAWIQMPLEGTAALLNRAGSCPSAFVLKCVADTSQNADTRDIVLRRATGFSPRLTLQNPVSVMRRSAKGSVRRQAARVCPLHNCDEISQAFFYSLFTSPSLSTQHR